MKIETIQNLIVFIAFVIVLLNWITFFSNGSPQSFAVSCGLGFVFGVFLTQWSLQRFLE